MERVVKFRGKTQDGKWVYGDLIHSGSDEIAILEFDAPCLEAVTDVVPESVGQFTGLHDKNGEEIYEGDILIEPSIFDLPRTVYWDHRFMRFGNISPSTCGYIALHDYSKPEVIGNIHDNPNLLNDGND